MSQTFLHRVSMTTNPSPASTLLTIQLSLDLCGGHNANKGAPLHLISHFYAVTSHSGQDVQDGQDGRGLWLSCVQNVEQPLQQQHAVYQPLHQKYERCSSATVQKKYEKYEVSNFSYITGGGKIKKKKVITVR